MTQVRVWTGVQSVALAFVILSIATLAYFSIQTHDALCTFRDDLERRANETAFYISQIELGIRPGIPGITTADLRRSLAAQKATLKSLDGLNCG